jgi:methyl-accepting chemotaxis protein
MVVFSVLILIALGSGAVLSFSIGDHVPLIAGSFGVLCVALLIGWYMVLGRVNAGEDLLVRAMEECNTQGISDGSVASESLQKIMEERSHYKDLCDAIVQGLPTAFLLVDTEERALATNRQTLEMLEIDGPVEAQLGKTLADIFYNDPGRETAVGKAMHQGQTFRNLEVSITGHKGGVHHVLANVYALRDSRGNCLGGFCIYIDMTALREKEDELAERNKVITLAADQADHISGQLASATEELSGQVDLTSDSSKSSMDLTGRVAASVEQMNSAVLEVARKAAETADLSAQALRNADAGEREVREIVERISGLEKQAQNLSGNMQELNQQAVSIESIMSVITDIADQTNLLALNAAIEAARAGEAGRGFAVVADEVRKLAEKTMDATRQVEENIKGIQNSTRTSVAATDETAKEVAETVLVVEKAGKSLANIVELTSQTSSDVESIAAAAEEQSTASEEIARSAEEINRVAQHTSEAMDESSIALNDLSRLASELQKIITGMRG